MLDLADRLPADGLRRAFDDADRRRILNVNRLARLLERTRGRRGISPLSQLLARRSSIDIARTRSPLEAELLELCLAGGIPRPQANVVVAGVEVDAYWPDARLAVEADGFEFHHTRSAFDRDHERDLLLQEAGVEVLRLTSELIRGEPERVIATIKRLRAKGR